MEFAKYYDVTKLVKEQLSEGKLQEYKDYEGIYVCEDTHDFWVCRILEGFNEEYEEEECCYLLERNRIDKYDVVSYIRALGTSEVNIDGRNDRDSFLKGYAAIQGDKKLISIILQMDEEGMENWDCLQEYNLDDCIEAIDGGYGIIELE